MKLPEELSALRRVAPPSPLQVERHQVHHYIARSVTYMTLVALVGCTSLRVVFDVSDASKIGASELTQTLAPNDRLTLTDSEGKLVSLRLVQISTTSLDGIDDNSSERVRLPLSTIAKIERREFDGAKTTFLVIAIAAGIYVVAKAAAQASLASNI